MSKTLLIVESPNKAQSIRKYMGPDFTVEASVGHVCDLPAKEYGVDRQTMQETYILREGRRDAKQYEKVIANLKKAVKSHDRVLLASDADREGEAIAWHLARLLGLDMNASMRIEFREVTRDAILKAIEQAKPINQQRVDAQRSRRIIDRIVGFDVSKEICWPAGADSAGRVQTPALHMLCELERKILGFKAETYFTLEVGYKEQLKAYLPEASDTGKDLADAEGADENDEGEQAEEKKSGKRGKRRFRTRAEADAVVAEASKHSHIVQNVEKSPYSRKPESAYDTAGVQKDASRKLKLKAKDIAAKLQLLFEAGYITYHRTDSTRLSPEAVAMAREYIQKTQPQALDPNSGGNAGKGGAQDAHEAIRPTHVENDNSPPPGTADLYKLIKARFLASQCKPATFEKTLVTIHSGPVEWLAEGSVLLDPGFLVFWGEYAQQSDVELPKVSAGQNLTDPAYDLQQQKTKPPSRWDTGTLTGKLKTSGLGRPSTYANIISTLLDRAYVQEIPAGKNKTVLQPTELGLQTDALMSASFSELVLPQYTAEMEASLDLMEEGKSQGRIPFLKEWIADFEDKMSVALPQAESYRNQHGLKPKGGASNVKAREETAIPCNRCKEANLVLIVRNGQSSFLACPSCRMTRDEDSEVRENACPKCGSDLLSRISQKNGAKYFTCARFKAEKDPCDHWEGTLDGSAFGEETEISCDRCGEATYRKIERKGKKGQFFLACPECKMTRNLNSKIKKGACKKCGSNLIEKSTADKRTFFSCVRYGAETNPCDFIESNSKYTRSELPEMCPVCKKHKQVQFTPTDPNAGLSSFRACGDPERDKAKRCKFIEGDGGGGKYEKKDTGQKCPSCKEHNIVLLTPRNPKDGNPFKACSDPARKCKFLVDAKAEIHPEPCPQCGRPVVEKFRKQTPEEKKKKEKPQSFWACTGYPECRHASSKE